MQLTQSNVCVCPSRRRRRRFKDEMSNKMSRARRRKEFILLLLRPETRCSLVDFQVKTDVKNWSEQRREKMQVKFHHEHPMPGLCHQVQMMK